jgi:hypothetical protein
MGVDEVDDDAEMEVDEELVVEVAAAAAEETDDEEEKAAKRNDSKSKATEPESNDVGVHAAPEFGSAKLDEKAPIDDDEDDEVAGKDKSRSKPSGPLAKQSSFEQLFDKDEQTDPKRTKQASLKQTADEASDSDSDSEDEALLGQVIVVAFHNVCDKATADQELDWRVGDDIFDVWTPTKEIRTTRRFLVQHLGVDAALMPARLASKRAVATIVTRNADLLKGLGLAPGQATMSRTDVYRAFRQKDREALAAMTAQRDTLQRQLGDCKQQLDKARKSKKRPRRPEVEPESSKKRKLDEEDEEDARTLASTKKSGRPKVPLQARKRKRAEGEGDDERPASNNNKHEGGPTNKRAYAAIRALREESGGLVGMSRQDLYEAAKRASMSTAQKAALKTWLSRNVKFKGGLVVKDLAQ